MSVKVIICMVYLSVLITVPSALAQAEKSGRNLVWVDRNGKEEPLAAESKDYGGLRISPDGEKVALSIYDPDEKHSDIWIWDFARETLTRLTFDEANDLTPLWTPDGKRIVFSSAREGDYNSLYWKQADGTGKVELLTSIQDRHLSAFSWSRNGNTLLFEDLHPTSFNADIGALSMEDDHEKTPLLHEEYFEDRPRISPDGRWMAYASGESGESEIYVRPFPDINTGKWKVSTNGGQHPLWSPDNKELFYINGDSVMAAVVETAPTFKAGRPETLFQKSSIFLFTQLPWDIHPDGKRFLMLKPYPETEAEPAPNIPVDLEPPQNKHRP